MNLTDATKTLIGKGYSLKLLDRFFFKLASISNTPEDRLLRTIDLKGKTVYDVGAHIGTKTVLFARKAEMVVAFEPNPESFAQLQSNVSEHHLKNVTAINIGLSCRIEDAMLTALAFSTATSSIHPRVREVWKQSRHKEWKVKLRTMDSLALPPPDFVKIDVEGHECEVLKGMRATLDRRHPVVIVELHGSCVGIESTGTKVTEFLSQLNYRIYSVEKNRCSHLLAVPLFSG